MTPEPASAPRATSHRTARSRRTVRRIPNAPRRADLVDVGACLLLSVIAFTGLSHVYAGNEYLVVALVGVVLGAAVSYAAYLLRQPLIVLIAVGVITFFVLGGVLALRNDPGVSVAPTGSTLSALAHQAVYGWKDLLTTVPPVDGAGPLLVLPYLLGLFTGLGAIAFATRTRLAFAPVGILVLTLAAVILLGDRTATLLTLRGAGFAIVGLGWACVRAGRMRPVSHTGASRTARLGTAVGALAIAGLAAATVGPHLPGEGTHARLVLRNYVRPNPNIGNYPSPLTRFRDYRVCQTTGQGLAPAYPLFSVDGTFPTGTAIRFASLDSYNGTVWQVTSNIADQSAKPNAFVKVGPRLNNPAPGKASTLKISIPENFAGHYSDYWLPTAGAIQAISFSGPQSAGQAQDFRYNLDTGTGLVPGALQGGDSYTLKVADTVPQMLIKSDSLSSSGTLPSLQNAPLDFVGKAAASLGGQSVGGPVTAKEILDLGDALAHKGFDSDCQAQYQFYLSGESQGRLYTYASGLGEQNPTLYVGDTEQSASFYALMIESLGVPARVVVGVEPKNVLPGTQITSADVTAWVEVESASGSWLMIPSETFDPTTPPQKQPELHESNPAGAKPVPPPSQGRPKSPLDDSSLANGASSKSIKRTAAHHSGGGLLPAWLVTIVSYAAPPLLVIALLVGLIVGAKLLRRRRRASRGTPAQRLENGWTEFVDSARDLGAAVLARRTRLEHAAVLDDPAAHGLARRADASIFGPADPSDADAAAYWAEIRLARKQMLASVSLSRRARAQLSLVSFRRLRPESST